MRFNFRTNPSQKLSDLSRMGRSVVAVGGTVSTITGWRVITFNASGELIVSGGPVDVEYLVVGGGGPGGSASGTSGGQRQAGAGGGAGGLLTNVGGSLLRIPEGRHEIVVGDGGVTVLGTSYGGGHWLNPGEDSNLANLVVAYGGGIGARCTNLNYLGTEFIVRQHGGRGGSNGGSGKAYGERDDIPPRSSFQGNSGGTSYGVNSNSVSIAGGGGGAGADGQNATSTTAGDGGAGVSNSITGTAVTYAGGGGGGGANPGAGGSGGGGAGGLLAAGTNGTANTGGGGGGGSEDTYTDQKYGGNGGSGIIVVRYRV